MAYADRNNSGSRLVAIIIVAILQGALAYAFITGLAQNFVKKAQEKLNTFDVAPPPPPPPDQPKPLTPPKTLSPPRPSPVPPPPDDPPVILDTPRAVDVQAPPPSPPAPPAQVADIGSSVDASSRAMNPPKYPPEEQRRGIQGTTVLIVSIDPNGGVLDVEVEKSSGNRNLDRAAVAAARRWKFNAEVRDGRKVASRVRVPVDFTLR